MLAGRLRDPRRSAAAFGKQYSDSHADDASRHRPPSSRSRLLLHRRALDLDHAEDSRRHPPRRHGHNDTLTLAAGNKLAGPRLGTQVTTLDKKSLTTLGYSDRAANGDFSSTETAAAVSESSVRSRHATTESSTATATAMNDTIAAEIGARAPGPPPAPGPRLELDRDAVVDAAEDERAERERDSSRDGKVDRRRRRRRRTEPERVAQA